MAFQIRRALASSWDAAEDVGSKMSKRMRRHTNTSDFCDAMAVRLDSGTQLGCMGVLWFVVLSCLIIL